jgi:hypothetical protein
MNIDYPLGSVSSSQLSSFENEMDGGLAQGKPIGHWRAG